MRWEDIQRFDETNAEHVQALRERCLEGGRTAYAFGRKRGWEHANAPETAEIFGVNMTLDKQFPTAQVQPGVSGGSGYWWKWALQMASWWLEGYHQARAEGQGQPLKAPPFSC